MQRIFQISATSINDDGTSTIGEAWIISEDLYNDTVRLLKNRLGSSSYSTLLEEKLEANINNCIVVDHFND